MLKDTELREAPGFRPAASAWEVAARSCGYIQARQAVSGVPTLAIAQVARGELTTLPILTFAMTGWSLSATSGAALARRVAQVVW